MPGELNQSCQLLQKFDLDELEDVGGCVERWLCKAKKELEIADKLIQAICFAQHLHKD